MDELAAEAFSGNSVVAVISGTTATGKTTMLRDLKTRAGAAGATVLSASCSRDERDVPFGILDQLVMRERLEDRARIADDAHRAVVRLADHGPVLIIVDDIQFADAESLRSLRYLTRRMLFAPVLIAVTWAPGVEDRPLPAVDEFIYGSNVRRIQLKPLTRDGIRQLCSDSPGAWPTPHWATRLHELSGGNPVLVRALLDDRDRVEPDADSGIAVGRGYQHAVVACVRALGPLGVRIARAVAVLGTATDLHLVSRLSEVDAGTGQRGVDLLTASGILRDGGFPHRVTQAAILADVPAGEHVEIRSRAAGLLYDDGAPVTTIAEQLLAVGPVQHDWALPILREAARRAQAGNDLARAIACLKLAHDCCTNEASRYELRAQITQLRWLQEPSASSRFLTLKGPMLAGKICSDSVLASATALLWNLQHDDALEMIGYLDGIPEVAEELHITRLLMSSIYPGVSARLDRPLNGDELDTTAPRHSTSPHLRLASALSAVLRNVADDHTIAQVEQILQDEGLENGPLGCAVPALLSLIYAERLESADAWCERLLTQARQHQTPTTRLMLLGFRSMIAFRQGDLGAASEFASDALGHVPEHELNISLGHAIAALAEASTAMGDYETAAACFAQPVPRSLFQTIAGLHYLYARGRHHLASQRAHAAHADFMACGELMRSWNMDLPAMAPWRLGAAEALLSLDEPRQATALVEEQLRLTRAPGRVRGMALRILAQAKPLSERPAILERAFEELQHSASYYEAACALSDLSRVMPDKAQARITARRAWRMARNCKAEKLCQTLMPKHPTSQAAAPGPATPGEDDTPYAQLSQSERRVAVLAAQGYANRDIADRLFVTVSTVEQHLTRIYRKMNIRNRDQLPTELRVGAAEGV
ncbi:LuxR C-terminal-related transcriptional regulator [Kitasatospora xanthocidica]|uniref:LuxR C-terminal-related transcriptional regulator n=1 Tax=Kitasatospora xanthocidica TaxID=83382 RepID=UPI0016799710|nr:LuxR family transcriptional regulator [Kitasatospora xanthocidica]